MALSGAAAQYISKEYGGQFGEQDSLVTVSQSATRLVGHNPDRVGLLFVNMSVGTITVQPGNFSENSGGITLIAKGGSVSMNVRDDLTLPTREWYGEAETPLSNLYVVELFRFSSSD